jgi:hypothetical protein
MIPFARAFHISFVDTRSTRAMSLCEAELASPSSQEMVTSLQDVPITVPRCIVVAPQQTRSPTLSVLDWSPVIPFVLVAICRIGHAQAARGTVPEAKDIAGSVAMNNDDGLNENAGAFLAQIDAIKATDVSEERLSTFTTEDDFNGVAVELLGPVIN